MQMSYQPKDSALPVRIPINDGTLISSQVVFLPVAPSLSPKRKEINELFHNEPPKPNAAVTLTSTDSVRNETTRVPSYSATSRPVSGQDSSQIG